MKKISMFREPKMAVMFWIGLGPPTLGAVEEVGYSERYLYFISVKKNLLIFFSIFLMLGHCFAVYGQNESITSKKKKFLRHF